MSEYGVTLEGHPMPGPWVRSARCRNVPTDLFFPIRGDDVRTAKEVCSRCPVTDACLQYALSAPDALVGIWGGTTAKQRRALRAEEPAAEVAAETPVDAPRAAPRGSLDLVLETLRSSPGAWARVTRFSSRHAAHAVASNLRTGRRPTPPGRWSFEGRLNDLGGSDLYARFDGEVEEQEGAA